MSLKIKCAYFTCKASTSYIPIDILEPQIPMSKNHLLFLFPFLRSFYRAALSKVLESPPPPLPPPPPTTTTTASSDWRRTVEGRVGEESREEGKEGEKVTVEGSTWEGRGGEGRKVSRKESSNKEIPGVAGELLAMMSGDWDKSVVETEVFWLALHLARYSYTPAALCLYLHSAVVKCAWVGLCTVKPHVTSATAVHIVRPNLITALQWTLSKVNGATDVVEKIFSFLLAP